MRFPLFLCLLAGLVSSAFATPARARTTTTKKVTSTTTRITTTTTSVAPPAPTATIMHDCSVFIQRWMFTSGENFFDVAYYDNYWTPASVRWQLFIQESQANVQPNEYLPDRQMGSQVLRVLNVENPAAYPFSTTDTGKVSVRWGSQIANSWEPATGCQVNVYKGVYERATYLCYFQCNVPFTGSG